MTREMKKVGMTDEIDVLLAAIEDAREAAQDLLDEHNALVVECNDLEAIVNAAGSVLSEIGVREFLHAYVSGSRLCELIDKLTK